MLSVEFVILVELDQILQKLLTHTSLSSLLSMLRSQMKLTWLELQTHYSYIMDKWTKGSYTKMKIRKGRNKNRDEKSILTPMLVEMKF